LTLFVSSAYFKAVLKDAVNDASDAVGGLDDMRDVLLFDLGLGDLFELYVVGLESDLLPSAVDGNAIVNFHLLHHLYLILFLKLIHERAHVFPVLLEVFAAEFLIERRHYLLHLDRGREFTGRHEFNFGCLLVSFQIESCSVSMSTNFDPPIRSLNLSIPAVLRIMGHLFGAMLAETDASCVNATGS